MKKIKYLALFLLLVFFVFFFYPRSAQFVPGEYIAQRNQEGEVLKSLVFFSNQSFFLYDISISTRYFGTYEQEGSRITVNSPLISSRTTKPLFVFSYKEGQLHLLSSAVESFSEKFAQLDFNLNYQEKNPPLHYMKKEEVKERLARLYSIELSD